VYPLKKEWATTEAMRGWLVLNIQAHDIPIDQSEDFYSALRTGSLNNYPAIGNDNRDTSYFLRMYLGCYQAADYLTTRPDWNGQTLVVMGASQGGLQTLVTAALHPKVTAALACVPAGCDFAGSKAGRYAGWPHWYDLVGNKDRSKVEEAAGYYDLVNFAPRIKCPVLIGTGLIDETCPPTGVLAAHNQLKCPKEIIIMPRSTHHGGGNTQAAYDQRQSAWLAELQAGRAAPVK
jgi:cephalosporin-C deacetylase-like acetyl esterase